ncbi:MAG: nucleotidyltransferase family protein [Candidatus Promineifilaceae bacterium]|nr:nucleotidyltransferase family protein [Candidatus Promineifilaceae bacterium]
MDKLGPLRMAVGSYYSRHAAAELAELLTSTPSPNWETTVRRGIALGLGPILHTVLGKIEITDLDPNLRAALAQVYYDSATHNLLALRELVQILNAFDQAQIPLFVLKGGALTPLLYDNPALRPMVDLDLLIAFNELDEAEHVLNQLGYKAKEPLPFKNEQGLFWNELHLIKPGLGTMSVELHWRLLNNPYYARRLAIEELSARAHSFSFEGLSVPTLSLEDHVLHLCSHHAYHHRGPLARTAVDIALILQSPTVRLNWDVLLARAKEAELTWAVRQTLITAANDWYVPIPDGRLEDLGKLSVSARQRCFAHSQRSEFLKVLQTFVMLPGPKLKSRFLVGQLFPDRDYLRWRYGVKAESPRIIAYGQRYLSGLQRLKAELGQLLSRLRPQQADRRH